MQVHFSHFWNCYNFTVLETVINSFQHTHGVVSTVWDINKGERKTLDRRMPTDIYPSSSVFSTLLSPSSLLDSSSFPHSINLETKFPIHFASRPTKVCSHSMQLCLQMRQHESTFFDIVCISGTNFRYAQNPGGPQAHKHWRIPRLLPSTFV